MTNNGFSIIPAFSLGKPAVLMDMAMGSKRLSFEPQFRFALEGRPWSFSFIYRYKAIDRAKFQLTFGGFIPGLNFVTRRVQVNGTDQEVSVVRRFLIGEISPKYILTKNTSIAFQYLYVHGFDKDAPQSSNFFSLRGSLTNIRISGTVFMDISPQLYYLVVDSDEGVYTNATITIGIKDLPILISSIVNKAIQSSIVARDFDWNISLIFNFNKQYALR